MLVANNNYEILDNNQQDEYNIVLKASNGDKIALEYIIKKYKNFVKAKAKSYFLIGADKDQSSLAPDNVLTSALKKVNVGVLETVKAFKNGDKIGGEERVYGLKEDGVGIPESTKNLVPQDVLDYVNTMAEKVKNGEIKVPSTIEELEQFLVEYDYHVDGVKY